jgi:hypothetical protein
MPQLAIVNMADQYTRITCGGSPLDVSFPVTGLLFGMIGDPTKKKSANAANTTDSNSNSKHHENELRILDADDIPTDLSENATIVVNLHQAVFPMHSVLGWYRVSATDDGPVANDLLLTRQLQQHYKNHGHEKEAGADTDTTADTTSADTDTPFVFALLQVPSATTAAAGKTEADKDKDEELPLTLYQLFDPASPSGSVAATSADNTNAVLIGLDHWNLATSDPERIAVERVVREQPQESGGDAAGPQNSMYVSKTSSLQHSLQAIQERLAVLAHFLEETAAGRVPLNHSLLRDVQGLMCQLGPIAAAKNANAHANANIAQLQAAPTAAADTASTSTTDSLDLESSNILQQLAILGKTVDAVTGYTEKFRVVHSDTNSNSRPATVGRDRRDMTSRLML